MKSHYPIFFVLLFLFPLIFFGQEVFTVKDVPNPKNIDGGWVSDPANYLSIEEVAELNTIINNLEATSTAQIAVVMLPGIGMKYPKCLR